MYKAKREKKMRESSHECKEMISTTFLINMDQHSQKVVYILHKIYYLLLIKVFSTDEFTDMQDLFICKHGDKGLILFGITL